MKEYKLTLVNWFTKEEIENTIIPKDQIGLKHECHESINI